MKGRGIEERVPLRLGISSCLLGNEVRFDAGHKRDPFLADWLGKFVEWVPVCPEVEAGMGIPRPAMRLVDSGDGVRLVEIRSEIDHTQSMEKYAAQRVRALGKLDLCGYVLKQGSPSCGMTRVKVYGAKKKPTTQGVGLYASALLGAYPSLPVEEEGRLHDAKLRENFIERIFAYWRLRELFGGRWSASGVVEFHSRHKLQLMAHSTESYRNLGSWLASIKGTSRPVFRDTYMKGFMDGLGQMATRGRNTNVLNHAAGHLKKYLDSPSRMELAQLIDEYRLELVPLVVPITLLRHHVRRFQVDYLKGQVFLEPHPKELMLRNHV